MTQEEAEILEALYDLGYNIKFTSGSYVNEFGHIYTNDDDKLCYRDTTYSEMVLETLNRRDISVYKPIPNWWKFSDMPSIRDLLKPHEIR